ncbi:MAG: dienelactone hydrolase family protein [Hyphomonadaceae bacterium]|nr:dienelactone hydrolase family protein [Hyphomonadaceae bacterium]
MTDIKSLHDGFSLSTHRVAAKGARKGGVVVIQEIFGISPHIRAMCDAFAARGYEALAPSLFDRIERGFQAGMDEAGMQKARGAIQNVNWDEVAGDVQAAIDALAPPVMITGFCYGGAVAWLAAQRCSGLSAASGFYGRFITALLASPPQVPIILHFGSKDAGIPLTEVDKIRAAYPDAPIHLYDAGHGFCREGSRDFDAPSRDLALQRTFDLFDQHAN